MLILFFFGLFSIVTNAQDPSLGEYPDVIITENENINVSPSFAPQNILDASAHATGFTGSLLVNPNTGLLSITNASQPGVYSVKVIGIHASLGTLDYNTFQLTVNASNICSTSFNENLISVAPNVKYEKSVIGDFNNDSIQDIAFIEVDSSWNGSARTTILLGDGNGGFNSSGTQPTIYDYNFYVAESDYINGLITVDFNKDGNLDIATAYRNEIIILYGNGNGNITSMDTIEVNEYGNAGGIIDGEIIDSLTTGYFNDDLFLDIAVSYSHISNTISGSSIRILYGANYINTNNSIESKTYNTPNRYVKKLTTGDYDNQHDAYDELLVVYDGYQYNGNVEATNVVDVSNEVSEILNLNVASNELEVLFASNSQSVMDVATGNIDAQGAFDSAVLTRSGIKVFLNNDQTDQLASFNSFIPLDLLYNDIKFINKNADGFIDLVLSSSEHNKVTILFGDGTGNFTMGSSYSIEQPYSLIIGDFNNDGLQDCAVDNKSGISILTAVNNSVTVSYQANTGPIQLGDYMLLYVDVINTDNEDLMIDEESLYISGVYENLFTIIGYQKQGVFSSEYPLHISPGDSAKIVVLFEPILIGDYSVTFNLAKGDCSNPIQTTLIEETVVSNYTGDLGTYPNTTINAGENIILSPSNAVFDFDKTFATTDTNFNGILSVSPYDGQLRITNPLKAGVYTIKVSGYVIKEFLKFNIETLSFEEVTELFSPTSTTFTLTVLDPICNSGDFEIYSTIQDDEATNLTAIAIGDFDFNNHQDLIVTYSNNSLPSFGDFLSNPTDLADDLFKSSFLMLGSGNGDFQSLGESGYYMFGFDPRSVEVDDYNGDGVHDVIAVNSDLIGNVFSRAGVGFGFFETPTKNPQGFTAGPPPENGSILTPFVASYSKEAAFSDFNNDGIKDMVVVNNGINVAPFNITVVPGVTNVLLGDGLALHNEVATLQESHFKTGYTSFFTNHSVSVVVGDFNGDGRSDYATASPADDKIHVDLGVETSESFNELFDLVFLPQSPIPVGQNPSSIVKGDFNNDGIQDLAVACRGVAPDGVTYITNGVVSIRLGNGNGGFSVCQDCEIEVGLNPSNIKIADFNGDGIEDFAVTNTFSNDISIRFGNGDGSFYGNTQILVEEGSVKLIVGDFNEDHILDISVVSTNAISILTGSPIGLLQLQVNGNDTVIPNNDTTPSLVDGTDFDNVEVNTSSVSRTFTIENTGESSIILNQSDILIEGGDADMFSLEPIAFPLFIAEGESVNFDVSFNPSLSGEKTASIKIVASNCITSFTNTFAIKATVVPPPLLGNYANTQMVMGENKIIIPDALPIHTLRAVAFTDSNFKGKLLVDPTTGNLSATNANQLGTYLVYVQAYTVSDISTTTTFELTISNSENCITGFVDTPNTDFNATGTNPSSVAIGDFNNDGKQDLAIANKDSSFISVKFGNGTDGYSSETTIPILPNTTAIALADFNGDGYLDITAINTTDFRVYNILGNGDGTFETPTYLNLQYSPTEIAVANFNNDGNKDVIITNALNNNVTIRLGTGTGNFYEEIVIDVGLSPKHVVTANFNNDTFTDFAVVNYADNTVSIHLSNGDGSFSNPTIIAVGPGPNHITVGDFNTDGNQDFATANKDANSISIGLGDGLGGATVSEINTTDAPVILKVGAFNGDGVLDLVTISNSAADALLKVYNGDGLGSFLESSSSSVCCNISSLAIGDFNTDEITDIALANKDNSIAQLVFGSSTKIKVEGNAIAIEDGDTTVSLSNGTDFGRTLVGQNLVASYTIKNTGNSPLLLNAGSITVTGVDSSLFSVQSINLPATVMPNQELSFDVDFLTNSEGVKEAIIHIESNDCKVIDYDFKVIAEGATFEISNYPTTTSVVSGNTIIIQPDLNIPPTNIVSAIAYIDNTSNTSIFRGSLTVNSITGHITVINAKPAGTYNVVVKGLQNITTNAEDVKNFTLTVLPTECSEGAFVEAQSNLNDNSSGGIAEGDFNNDGITDVATFIEDADENQVIINLGNSYGTFQEPQFINVSNTDIHDISVSDFNGDGHQDLLTRYINYNSFFDTKLYINLGNGDASFGETITINLNERFENHGIGDFNNDGKQDIVLVYETLTYLLGKGDGTFDTIITNTFPPFADTINAGDFNSDGNLDFITLGDFGRIAVFRGLGNGTFNRNYLNDIQVEGRSKVYAMADFNNDNISDIVVSSKDYFSNNNNQTGSFKVYFGDDNANFTAQPIIPINYNEIKSLNIGDFNGDNNQDILINYNEVLFGDGNGGFPVIPSVSEMDFPFFAYNQAIIGDFNKDGKHDYVSTNSDFEVFFGASNINVYSNLIAGEIYHLSNAQTVTSAETNTYFETCIISTTVSKTYTIENTSSSNLNITGISLAGNTTNAFSLEDLDNFPTTISPNSSTTFRIEFSPTSAATTSAVLHIYNNDCLDTDFSFAIKGDGISPEAQPAIGTYNTIAMASGENKTINPITPITTTALNARVYTNSNFKGVLTANPITGDVIVTNAYPAGTYQIYVENLVACNSATTSFQLIVEDTRCSTAAFENITIQNQDLGSIRNTYVADFNEDNIQDLLVTTSSSLIIQLGNGDGTFTFHNQIIVEGSGSESSFPREKALGIGDFNNDGHLDVVSTQNNRLTMYLGDGNANFTLATVIEIPNLLSEIAEVADFNNDNNLDVIVKEEEDGVTRLVIFFGNGIGGFTSRKNITVDATWVGIGDFNHDTNKDIVVLSRDNANTIILSGDGLTNFVETKVWNFDGASALLLDDFNNDGEQDIAIGVFDTPTPNPNPKVNQRVLVYLGSSSGVFSNTPSVITQLFQGPNTYGFPQNMLSGDFNSDGKQDIIVKYFGNGLKDIQILLTNSLGGFDLLNGGDESPIEHLITDFAVGDFNTDKRQDIVYSSGLGGVFSSINILFGVGTDMLITGNDNVVNSASTITDTLNSTDFGTTCPGDLIVKTFTIHNEGLSDLELVNNAITINGGNQNLFTIGDIALPLTIAHNDSATFTVTYAPITVGVAITTINVVSNDCKTPIYSYNITASSITQESEPPVIVCPVVESVYYTNSNSCYVIVDVNAIATDNCTLEPVITNNAPINNRFPVGATTVVFTATDASNNASTCEVIINVEDNIAPNIECQDDVVVAYGESIAPADIGSPTVSYNCGNTTLVHLDVSYQELSGCGMYSYLINRFWTVTDDYGNSSTCLQIITVEDNVLPTAIAQDITVSLDATGLATLTAADIDNGSADGCGILSLAIDTLSFDCSNIGDNTVTLTVTDTSNNVSTTTAIVTVEDNTLATAIAQNITVSLDATGSATITTADIDNGSTDGCGILSLAIDTLSFDCSNIGDNTVTLTVTDTSNNVSTTTATVTVEDNVLPTAIAQDITVSLDATGLATLTVADIDNGSADGCGILSLAIDTLSFDCSNIGDNTVTLTVTDTSNNISTTTATVTVEDNVLPTAIAQDIMITLDDSGNANITAEDIDNGSSDRCGIDSLSLDIYTFSNLNIGENNVVLTVTDVNGNVSTTTAIVLVIDGSDPNLEVIVYPVPAVDYLNFKIPNYHQQNLSYRLYTIRGKLVYNNKVNGTITTLPVSGLSHGVYVLRILLDDKEVKSIKVIIN